MKSSRGFTLIELLIVIAIVAIISLFSLPVNVRSGTGEKIGQIVKVSKEGFFCKTWEAQLIRGGMNDGSGSFGTVPFDFTIENGGMAKIVTDAMRNQTEVVITYETEGMYWFCRSGSGGRFLKSIKPASSVAP